MREVAEVSNFQKNEARAEILLSIRYTQLPVPSLSSMNDCKISVAAT